MSTLRETAIAAYVEALEQEHTSKLTTSDRDAIRRKKEEERRASAYEFARQVVRRSDNPLPVWFPDDEFRFHDVDDQLRRYVIVSVESELQRSNVSDRIFFMLHMSPGGGAVEGVTITTPQDELRYGHAGRWSGADMGTQFYLTGPTDVGRYLRQREENG